MDMINPDEYRRVIDKRFEEALEKGISRMDVEWGKWSAEMNRKLKIRIQQAGELQILYKYTFIYWVLMSHVSIIRNTSSGWSS
jgi:hypothetical protein